MAETAGLETEIGRLGLVALSGSITRLIWQCDAPEAESGELFEASRQLKRYFAGALTAFDLPLRPHGSEFAQKVWIAMLGIPYGETRTYGELAREVGGSAQSVGNACGSNPIPIIIPCHRVVAANGLGGYSGEGGIDMKIRLLRLENAIPNLI